MPRRNAIRVVSVLAAPALVFSACGDRGDSSEAVREESSPAGLAGAAVPVTVVFPEVVSDSVAVAFLQAHSLRPYAIHLAAGGLVGVHREPRSEASLEVIGRARQEGAALLTTTVCAQQGRARALVRNGDPGDPVAMDSLRVFLSDLERLDAALDAFPAGEAVLYAVHAVGAPADIRAARNDGRARTLAPPPDSGPQADPPDPPPPPGTGPRILATVAAMAPGEIVEATRTLAERGLERCHDYPAGRDPS